VKRKAIGPRGAGPQAWRSPTLRYLGRVADVVNMPGGGKTSTKSADTGDPPFKPPGQAMMDQ
jgi:hypothetical protein